MSVNLDVICWASRCSGSGECQYVFMLKCQYNVICQSVSNAMSVDWHWRGYEVRRKTPKLIFLKSINPDIEVKCWLYWTKMFITHIVSILLLFLLIVPLYYMALDTDNTRTQATSQSVFSDNFDDLTLNYLSVLKLCFSSFKDIHLKLKV